MNKLTVLLDIDNTILDISSVKNQISTVIDDNYGRGASEKFWQVYEQVRDEFGFVKVKEIATRFAKLVGSPDYASAVAAFIEVPFEEYLLPGARELIDFLGKNTNLVVFSDGDDLFQGAKVKRLGLNNIASEVIISESKKDLFPRIKAKHSDVVVIDDKPAILDEAKKAMDCKTVWVKFGKYAEGKETIGADFESENLAKVGEYIKSLQRDS